jgi:hypothetical protein
MALDVAVSQAPVEGAVLWPVGRSGCWSTEVDYRVNVQQDRDGDETPALVVILCHRHVGRIGGTSFDPVYSLGWGTGPGVGRWCDAEVRHGGELGGGWAVSCEIER